MESYAVLWSEPAQPVRAGKLELEPTGLRLEGSLGRRGGRQVHRVFYEDIESVHVGRGNGERLAGRPALVLDLAVGGPLRIGSVQGLGVLSELAERLGHLTATGLAV
ncbi:MAG TPA: hypothetical protein VFJ91_07295 [Gaiellaceae bacterium]|jgi:hypothetical protein|nr:hypothetical protein [Gaiellaceae bacterium]